MRTAVIIPCYCEEKFIGDVVKKVRSYVDNVVVVDNGSSDGTVLEARKAGAVVVYSHRKGMGAAISKGIQTADADIYVTMDGDGQHNPDDIPKLLQPILEGNADFVVGVRVDNGSMPKYRRLVNDILARFYSFNSPIKLQDVQCGYRVFNKKISEIPIKSYGFGCVIELLIKVRKFKLKVMPVEVSCIYHESIKQNSTLNPIKHGIVVICGMIRWMIWERIGL